MARLRITTRDEMAETGKQLEQVLADSFPVTRIDKVQNTWNIHLGVHGLSESDREFLNRLSDSENPASLIRTWGFFPGQEG